MTVRISDDLAAFVDHEVATGHASSRATVIAEALSAMRKQAQAEAEIAAWTAQPPHVDGMDELAAWGLRQEISE